MCVYFYPYTLNQLLFQSNQYLGKLHINKQLIRYICLLVTKSIQLDKKEKKKKINLNLLLTGHLILKKEKKKKKVYSPLIVEY